jgi:AcrR family transcriptional regulator
MPQAIAMPPGAAARPRRSHAERSARTRLQVLGAAADLVRNGGMQAASMFEVAKAAGVTPGALQHHFGSKAELMMQVIAYILRTDDGDGVAWPAPTVPLASRCRAFVDALWATVYEPPRFLTAWAIYFGSHGERDLLARIGVRRQQVNAELRLRLLDVFPELSGRADVADLADLVFASLRGLALTRLFDGADRGARQIDSSAGARRTLAGLIETHCLATPMKSPKKTPKATAAQTRAPLQKRSNPARKARIP